MNRQNVNTNGRERKRHKMDRKEKREGKRGEKKDKLKKEITLLKKIQTEGIVRGKKEGEKKAR